MGLTHICPILITQGFFSHCHNSSNTFLHSPPLSNPIYSGLGYLDNHTSSNVFIDSLDDLYFTSLTSNQPVDGSVFVHANNYLFQLGLFTVNGPMRSTSTLFQAMGLSASFSGRSPYFFLVCNFFCT
jgi:hypothetical protein